MNNSVRKLLKIIEREYVDNYQWRIETSKGFSGRLGIIDNAKIDEVENSYYIYNGKKKKLR